MFRAWYYLLLQLLLYYNNAGVLGLTYVPFSHEGIILKCFFPNHRQNDLVSSEATTIVVTKTDPSYYVFDIIVNHVPSGILKKAKIDG